MTKMTNVTRTATRNMTPVGSAVTVSVREKILSAMKSLSAAFIERDEEIELLMIGLVSRENVLFIGSPGVAKSAIQEGVQSFIDGPTFATLMHRSTSVDELMGQLSLKAYLDLDVWKRNIVGRLPNAITGVLDEIFKSSPVCLSPLLKILNERVYEIEGRWHRSPLACVMAASNEWPADNDTSGIDNSALFDRFLIRKEVDAIATDKGIDRLLDVVFDDEPARTRAPIGKPEFAHKITPEELLQAHNEARAVTWTRPAYATFKQIFTELKAEGVVVSDRRKKKAEGVVQAAAWLAGSPVVHADHLAPLAYVLWDDHHEQPKKCAKIVAKHANPARIAVKQHRKEVDRLFESVDVRNIVSVQETCEKLDEIMVKLDNLKRVDMTADLVNEIEGRMSILRAKSLMPRRRPS